MKNRSAKTTIFVLGLVSFLSDCSSEMIYPLLPVFLSQVLGAGVVTLGLIEGVAESAASLFKVFSGQWTDQMQRRKPLVVLGYGIAGVVRPLIGLSHHWGVVLGLRFVDRIGKGIRTPPRDALIADVTEDGNRGRAYGFHRAMDNAGAVAGPLIAGALISTFHMNLREVFLWASVPALLTILVLYFGIREAPNKTQTIQTHPKFRPLESWRVLGKDFRVFLFAMILFTLGNSTDAFLLVRLSSLGVPTGEVAILWALHNLIRVGSTYVGGRLSDRMGKRTMIVVGWVYFSFIYFCFAWTESSQAVIWIFMAYAIFFGLVEPAERAWIADLAPAHLRGTAFGLYHFSVGMAALPASLLFGLVWKYFGVPAAFIMGGSCALAATFLILWIKEVKK